MLSRLLVDLLKYAPSQLAPILRAFLAIPIYTRVFTPEQYGMYSITLAVVNVMTLLNGWIGTSIIRFYPEYEQQQRLPAFNVTIWTTWFLSSGVILLGALALRPGIPLFQRLQHLFFWGLCLFPLLSAQNMNYHYLRIQKRPLGYTAAHLTLTVLTIGLNLTLIFVFHVGVEALLIGNILAILLVIPWLLRWTVNGHLALRPLRYEVPLLKKAVRYGIPLAFGNLSNWILHLSDRFLLEYFLGFATVGVYATSYFLAERSMMILVNILFLGYWPFIVRLWEERGPEATHRAYRQLLSTYLAVATFAVFLLSFLAHDVLRILLGKSFVGGYVIVPWVASGFLLFGLQQLFQTGLIVHKTTRPVAVSIFLAGLMNIGLNILMIPHWGMIGAAVASFLSYLFLNLMIFSFSRRRFPAGLPFRFWGLFGLAVAPLVVLVGARYRWEPRVPWPLWYLLAALATGFFFLMLTFTGELRFRDLLSTLRNQVRNKLGQGRFGS